MAKKKTENNVPSYSLSSGGYRNERHNYKPGTPEDIEHFSISYLPYAIEATRGTHVSPEALLAQAYEETRGGRDFVGNNMFGRKEFNPNKPRVAAETPEITKGPDFWDDIVEVDGRQVLASDNHLGYYGKRQLEDGTWEHRVDQYFAASPSIEEGFKQYVKNFYYTPGYSKALSDPNIIGNPDEFLKQISGIYSTNPNYYEHTSNYLKYITPAISSYLDETIPTVIGDRKQRLGNKVADVTKSMFSKIFPKADNGMYLHRGNVEAEGGELVLQNGMGDYAIIPKKYRSEVKGMISDGCYSCIDDFVSKLPKASDFAELGTVINNNDIINNPPTIQETINTNTLSPEEYKSKIKNNYRR